MQGEVLYDVLSGTIFESPICIEFAGMPVILMNYASGVIFSRRKTPPFRAGDIRRILCK